MALRIHPPNNMENEIDGANIQNGEEEFVIPEINEPELGLPADLIEVEPKDDDNADTEVLKQKNQELYEQLKKAKGFIRDQKTGHWVKKEQPRPQEVTGTGDITKTELYSLVKANVPDEDVNEVVIYARSHNISVTDALKTAEVKAILGVKQDYRKSAEAASIHSSRYGASEISNEVLINNALKGSMPDNEEDINRLIKARIEEKRVKRN